MEIGGCQASRRGHGGVCRGAEFSCTSVMISNKDLWKSCIGDCPALWLCFMGRCWRSSFPSRRQVRGRQCCPRCAGASRPSRGTGREKGETCIHRLSGGTGQEAEDLYVQAETAYKNKIPARRFSFCLLNATAAWCGTVLEAGPAGSGVLRCWG